MLVKQLSLLFESRPNYKMENFVAGGNEELVESLGTMLMSGSQERFYYIWGSQASGKTHLLTAVYKKLLEKKGRSVLFFGDGSLQKNDLNSEGSTIIVDNVHLLDKVEQHIIFNWYNYMLSNSGYMIVSGDHPPALLSVREDLKTRLGSGLVYRIKALTDNEKIDVINRYCTERGFALSGDVLNYVVTHESRDLAHLLELVDGIDSYSIQTHRRITIPLVKEYFEINQ